MTLTQDDRLLQIQQRNVITPTPIMSVLGMQLHIGHGDILLLGVLSALVILASNHHQVADSVSGKKKGGSKMRM